MKPKTQNSVLKWASLLTGKQITSIIDIQNTDILVKMLNILQPHTFQQLQQIDERASNSILNILKFINSYYKQQLHCNVSSLIDNLNIFKTPLIVWELLIGVAIKGKNRDTNINVILQMEGEEQSELMPLFEDVIQKLNAYEMNQVNKNSSELQDHSDDGSMRGRKKSNYIGLNSRANQFFNQLVEQNETLKQKNHQLHNEVSQLKAKHQQSKKAYQQRLNHFKTQRYQFLEALTEGSSGIESSIRSRKDSQFNFRQSVQSSDSNIFVDPLHDLNISLSGSLEQIATDMLNAVKNLKREVALQVQKSSLLEDHNKDLKLSFNRLIQENKTLKQQLHKAIKLQKEFQAMKNQNDDLLNHQTKLIKKMTELQQQKFNLKETLEKLKLQKQQLTNNLNSNHALNTISNAQHEKQKIHSKENGLKTSNNTLDVNFNGSNGKIDIMKAPSMLLRQMGSQIQPESTNLNEEIDYIKTPMLRQKHEKQLSELRGKNDLLRQQNKQLKKMNKILQKTIHKSMQKSQQIQKNIQEGYKALFGINNLIVQKSTQNIVKKQQNQPTSPIQINISNRSNQWNESQINEQSKKILMKQKEEQTLRTKGQVYQYNQNDSKIIQFYTQIKTMVESYEQKQLFMMIQIESLKKQLSDLMNQKTKYIHQNQNDLTNHDLQLQPKQKPKRQMKIKHNVIQQKIQSEKQIDILPQQSQSNKKFIVSRPASQLVDLKSEYLTQIKKQQSVLMLNINISGPGEESQNTQNSHQYEVRKSKIIASDSLKTQSYTQIQNKRNKEIYPSEQFIEIQEGQDLNQNDIPLARKSHQNSENSDQVDNKTSLEQQVKNHSLHQRKLNFLHLDITNNNKNISTLSGIGLRFSKDPHKSYFAKSGFYNQSFIELSNKLQEQIQTDINEITKNLNQRDVYDRFGQQSDQDIQERKRHGQPIQKQQAQNQELIEKLQRIKKSYGKIQQFHINSSAQLQSQLKQQLSIQKSEIIKLKIMNQSLKQSLTMIIAQKQSTISQMKQLKNIIKNLSTNRQIQQLSNKFSQMFKTISELQLIMPQLQLYMQGSKTKQFQMLYSKQKLQKQQLQQEIQILMETIVYFRNLAIFEDEE